MRTINALLLLALFCTAAWGQPVSTWFSVDTHPAFTGMATKPPIPSMLSVYVPVPEDAQGVWVKPDIYEAVEFPKTTLRLVSPGWYVVEIEGLETKPAKVEISYIIRSAPITAPVIARVVDIGAGPGSDPPIVANCSDNESLQDPWQDCISEGAISELHTAAAGQTFFPWQSPAFTPEWLTIAIDDVAVPLPEYSLGRDGLTLATPLQGGERVLITAKSTRLDPGPSPPPVTGELASCDARRDWHSPCIRRTEIVATAGQEMFNHHNIFGACVDCVTVTLDGEPIEGTLYTSTVMLPPVPAGSVVVIAEVERFDYHLEANGVGSCRMYRDGYDC